MSEKKAVVALVYDFDGTLIPGNMQDYGFIKSLGIPKEEFWKKVNDFAKRHEFDDEVLAYMYYMVEAARGVEKKVSVRAEDFRNNAQDIRFFKGVEGWFNRLKKRWSKHFDLQHYVISSGLQEMIEGCKIAHHFKKIYACKFIYDEVYGYPIWPGRVVNFTTKTQYLFRINKGTDDVKKLNQYQPEEKRPVPFRRMLYFGDGYTDIPCMRLVKEGGGHVFAMYDSRDPRSNTPRNAALRLVKDGRAQIALAADYSSRAEVVVAVEKVLDLLRAKLALDAELCQK